MKAIPLLRAQLFHLLETGLLQVFLKNTDEVSSSQETLVIKRPVLCQMSHDVLRALRHSPLGEYIEVRHEPDS